MTYTVSILRSAQKSLAAISGDTQDRIITAIHRLASDPRPPGAKKLIGRDGWRIRVGDYRIIYDIGDKELTILIVDIGHRREVYR